LTGPSLAVSVDMIAPSPERTQSLLRRRAHRLCLMVLADGVVTTHALPATGRAIIGRTHDCAIAIDSSEVSRQHAAIEVGGDRMWVEDLGSTNGTRVRDTVVERGGRVQITPGDSIELGSVIALLQYLPEVPHREAAAAGPVILDSAMVALYRVIDRLAVGTLPILVLGETGVGKEVVAEQLHARSPRRNKPLVRLNCAAFTEQLLESELFGHVRGAFTGATANKTGLLVSADGGTVFLDEVADLPLAIQAKLLRVLEAGDVLPVGALEPVRVDVRIVSATNADIGEAIEDGRFREDLYHRLAGATLVVPPLRERPSEILPIAQRFLHRAARRNNLPVGTLSPEAEQWIARHAWPGNVRELRNVMERALLLSGGGAIELAHLPAATAADDTGPRRVVSIARSQDGADTSVDDRDPDRAATLDALARCNGNQTRAARMLGIARSTLIKRLDLYNVPRPRK
jgi:transcriptional regulator with PAS, ATPase and Fis domain